MSQENVELDRQSRDLDVLREVRRGMDSASKRRRWWSADRDAALEAAGVKRR
jgi:hypothetical protein